MIKVNPPVKPRNQVLSSCCWLTCLEMLFVWKGKNPYTILDSMDQSPNLFAHYMKDNGIDADECKETAKMLGLRWSGNTPKLDINILQNLLQAHGPLWIAGKFSRAFDHVIVLTGVEPETGRITIVNPFRNNDLTESPQTIDWLQDRGYPWTSCDASIMYW